MRGHGHVTPNEDGSSARCGGPAICKVCALELAEKNKAQVMARDPVINDIKTLHWLHKQFYEIAETKLSQNEIKMFHNLQDKYVTLDVTKILLDHYDELSSRIAQLESKLESAIKTLESCRAAMDYAYEDHADQYYLNVKNTIDATLKYLKGK